MDKKPFLEIDYTPAGGDPPVASFTKNQTAGTAPLSVGFTDTSTNTPDEWHWWVNNVTGNDTPYEFASTQNPSITLGIGNWSFALNASNSYGYNITPGYDWVNVSAEAGDTTPPASITNLSHTNPSCTEINWTWDNPTDADFNYTVIYWNDVNFFHNLTNTTTYDLWYGLFGDTTYNFSAMTCDITGNCNSTAWVNQTVVTSSCGNPPVANFTADNTTICEGETVQFNDTSTNDPKVWDWDINGDWYDVPDPAYGFTTAGLYSINLTVSNDYGSDFEYKADYINVTPCGVAPVANFTSNETTVCMYDVIQFNDTSTNIPTAWFWLFGDSQDSHIQDPTHYYDVIGTFNVSLWAGNNFGNDTIIKTDYITVNDCSAPTVDFSANNTCDIETLAVLFTDISTGATSWYWEFGEGNISVNQSPVFTYTSPGVYTVSHNAANVYGTTWINKTGFIIVGVNGTFCSAPAGNITTTVGGVSPRPIPLETNIVLLPFLLVPFVGIFYVFKGMGEDTNPVWGDIIMSGLAMIASAMVAIWFLSGGITTDPVTLENSSYMIPGSMSVADAHAIHEEVAREVSIIGDRGSGIFMRSAVSTAEAVNRSMTVVHTHDIIVVQYQDFGLMFLYLFLFAVSVGIFAWSIKTGITLRREKKEEENSPERWRA